MAAKQQGKRKARDAKRKKIQKKHQLAKRKQKKLQPRKQKKHQARPKRRVKQSSATKSVDSGPERICSPRLFAAKIFRQMPKVRMEIKARSLMKTLLTDVYDHVATEVENLSQKNELSNISGTDVQAALKEAMTKEMAKHSAEPISAECA
ncbi:histone H2B.v3-like [Pantherophis guttatus]|uniref:Histone H2B.v3-like n=1 Tax=Pantherophis guttatus TaxID=94885 RepID=A0A6P9D7L8_PANGU|nr:histone H2B.v3-like [Pantherophis guttatus]